MAAGALVLYIVWALVAFAVRAAIQWHRTGDTGVRLGTEARFTLEWWARLAFVAALVLGAAAPVAALTGIAPATPPIAVGAAGAVIVVVGIVGTFLVQLAMGRSWRIGVDPTEATALVADGPFRIVRNPIFTAMVITEVGFVLMVPSSIALSAFVLLVAGLEVQVRRVEEPYLLRTHGEAYADYAATVGRFVPRVGRISREVTAKERVQRA